MSEQPASAEADSSQASGLVSLLGFTYVVGLKVSRRQLLVLALLDWVNLLWLGREAPAPVPLLDGNTVAIGKIDLLGDVLMVSPFLSQLRRQVPTAKLLLIVATWSAEAGRLLQAGGLCDEVILYDPPTMSPFRHSWGRKFRDWFCSLRRARRRLRELRPDVYIDLRANSPNSLLLARLARVPHKIGFGFRGYSWLLQQSLPFAGEAPMGQQYLDALTTLGLAAATYEKPLLAAPPAECGFAGDKVFAAIHPFSRNAGKMISDSWWRELLPMLSAQGRVVVLGNRSDLENVGLVKSLQEAGCDLSAVGQTSFREAVACVYQSAVFVGVDSVFAHVALAYDKPALVAAVKGASFRPAFPAANANLFYYELEPRLKSVDGLSPVLHRFATRAGLVWPEGPGLVNATSHR